MALKRLKKELKELTDEPLTGISAGIKQDDILNWEATIIGPSKSPYAGGMFKLNIEFPGDYPFKPPKIKFSTKKFSNLYCVESFGDESDSSEI